MDLCRHILLVDEDVYRQRNHAFLLKISGFRVQTLKTPMEALNWLSINRSACNPCDLILLVGFYGLHGDRQLFEAVKAVNALVPVLIVDRDPISGKQLVWRKPGGEQPSPPSISFHHPPQLVVDIVKTFFGADSGENDDGEMVQS